MSMYSTNGARIHAETCGCKLKMTIDHKPHLGGSFERFEGTGKGCSYVARGRKVPEALKSTADPVEMPAVLQTRAAADDGELPAPDALGPLPDTEGDNG